jgi:hypothetical protein
MRKVVVINSVTLDGVTQAPGRPDEDTRGGFAHGGRAWRARAAALRQNAAADQRRAEANAREVFDDYARLAR